MALLKGSLSYTRFFVDGELPDDFRERFMRAIRHRVIKPLEADEDALERTGYCAVGEPFELELGYDNVFYNNFLNLGIRTDRWVIPAALLRARFREAEAAYLAKKGRERLNKREKEELKQVVERKLRKQFVPAMRVIDLSWSLEEGVVRFFSQAARPALAMTDLFQKTFHLKLVPEAPYTLAERLGLSKAEDRAWDTLEPTLLTIEERL
jgi:recombination associated protein RdgC